MKEKKYTAVNEFGCATDGDVFEQVHGTDMWHMHREEEGAITEMFLSEDVVQGLIETGYLAEVCEATKDRCAFSAESNKLLSTLRSSISIKSKRSTNSRGVFCGQFTTNK